MSHRVQPDLVSRSRKSRALLAGGAILGLGATATLAAWSDSVLATSAFTTGTFSVQAAAEPGPGSNWNSPTWKEFNSSEQAGTLEFPLTPPTAPDGQQGLVPGNSVYAPLYLRVKGGDYNASISSNEAPTIGGISGNGVILSRELDLALFRNIAPEACNAAGVANKSPIHVGKLDRPLGAGLASLSRDETPVGLCFEVSMPGDVSHGVAGAIIGQVHWHLVAESK